MKVCPDCKIKLPGKWFCPKCGLPGMEEDENKEYEKEVSSLEANDESLGEPHRHFENADEEMQVMEELEDNKEKSGRINKKYVACMLTAVIGIIGISVIVINRLREINRE